MLIEFRVENHRSLKTEQVLTMEAGRVDGDATIPRTVPGYSKPLLPVAALYGANASGKSNVLSGLAFMREAVISSHRRWEPNEGVPRDPFAWGENRPLPSMYEASFVLAGTRFLYGFVVSDEKIEEEWLHAWPKGKQQTWFEREGQEFTFKDNLKGERRLIQDVTRSNALFLSVGAQHGNDQLKAVYTWFSRIDIRSLALKGDDFAAYRAMMNYLYFDARSKTPTEDGVEGGIPIIKDFREMLTKADLGIVDFRVVSPEASLEGIDTADRPAKFPAFRSRIELKHHAESDNSWLPLEKESKGTRTLFAIGIPLLRALRLGGTVVVDELEASLHPKFAIEIIKQFNNPKTNPKNAQLIFTTHDTNLLGNDAGEPVLRRDQVWLTEKDKEGATTLYPLTDFKPRKPENLERGYLQGRYGAIPYLGRFSLANEVST